MIDVHLEPWSEVEVRLADLPALPPGVAVAVRMRSVGNSAVAGDEGLPGGASHGGSANRLAPPQAWKTVTDKAIRLPVGDESVAIELALCSTRAEDLVTDSCWDDRYDDSWPVWRHSAPAARIEGFLPTTVNARQGAVLITVPAAARQQALSAMRAREKVSVGAQPARDR